MLLIAAVIWCVRATTVQRLRSQLLLEPMESVAGNRRLVQVAITEAQPLFEKHCASCHGRKMQGDPALGAPDLSDGVWLYGTGSVFDIERTILYGARSQMPRSHNVSEMPAFGLTGMLRPDEIREMVQYVLQLSGQPHDRQAAQAGAELFAGRANCIDCHGPDGKGNADYGAPDLTVNVWNNGGDAGSLYKSMYFGLHRTMPGWIGTLSLQQIRALAIYVHATSHPAGDRKSSGDAYAARNAAP